MIASSQVMCLDSLKELKQSWQKLFQADQPERAMKVFSDTTMVSYQKAMGSIRKKLSDGSKVDAARLAVWLGKYHRKNYKLAGKLAEKGE